MGGMVRPKYAQSSKKLYIVHMKTKTAILIFISGLSFLMIGALFKILHWSGGEFFLVAGIICQTAGLILIAYKLLTHPRLKNFLEELHFLHIINPSLLAFMPVFPH